MTDEQIMQWARKAWPAAPIDDGGWEQQMPVGALRRFAALVAADAYERAAMACGSNVLAVHAAAAIRALAKGE